MERQGVIAGYTIVAGRAAGLVAFVGVRLGGHERALTGNFEEQVIELPAVSSAWHITGSFDYLLRVSVNDLADYRRFHAEQLAAIPGVAQVTTFVVMKELTAKRGYERT
jgi:Lrp/AsnC family leucine-responsive transcriptional regulator